MIYQELNEHLIPMSIQQCYELFFKSAKETDPSDLNPCNINVDDYRVYSHLVHLGYILRRINPIELKSIQKLNVINDNSNTIDYSQPLINSNDYSKLDTLEIFKKLNNLIPNISMHEIKYRSMNQQLNNEYRLLFDVYTADKNFKKSMSVKEPTYRVSTSIVNNLTKWPNFNEFLVNDLCSNTNTGVSKTKNLYAFVDNGDVLYYSFNLDLNLPFLFQS
jgi:hypothetical protein